jgi:hypothetical protein
MHSQLRRVETPMVSEQFPSRSFHNAVEGNAMARVRAALTIFGLVLLIVPKADAGVSLILGQDVTASSCPLSVALTLGGGDAIVSGVQVDMLFPSAEFVFESCALQAGLGGSINAAITTDVPPPPGMSRLRIIVQGNGTYSDGQLATCTLTTAAGAAQGTYNLTADRPVVSGPSGGQMGVAGFDGSATVTAPSGCCP